MAQPEQAQHEQQPTFRFLDLPPEIRNPIYRQTLLEPQRIDISHRRQPQEPSLLLANTQIRQEAAGIYYRENEFQFKVYDYNSTLVQKWFQSSQHRNRCRHVYNVKTCTKWNNLLKWLKAYYDGDTRGHRPRGESNGARSVHTRMFRVVDRMKNTQKLPWEEIMLYLEDIHQALVAADPAWA